VLRYLLADILIEATVSRLLSYQVISIQARGQVPNKEASIAKLFLSEVRQRITVAEVRMYGLRGAIFPDGRGASKLDAVARNYLAGVSATIAGGTSEIQRNIIAQRGLGLPRGS